MKARCPYLRVVVLTIPLFLLTEVAWSQASWEVVAPFPDASAGRTEAVGVFHGGRLYALGGTPYRYEDDVPVGDPPERGAADYLTLGAPSWTQAKEFDAEWGRMGAGVDALGRLIAFGPAQAGDPEGSDKTFIYDPVLGFETDPSLPGKQLAETNFAHAEDDEGRLYSIGGGPGVGGPNQTGVERFDALLDSWTLLSPMPEARSRACAVHDGQGCILVFGGFNAAGTARTNSIYRYHIASDIWSLAGLLPIETGGDDAYSDQRAVLGADGMVWLMGGINGAAPGGGTSIASVHMLDPVTMVWTTGPVMMTPRHAFAAAMADDDYIYAMGGSDAGNGTHLVERIFTVRDCDGNGIHDSLDPDTDDDGHIDACDVCPDDSDPDQTDSDGDGVGDVCDNCPANANPDQADADNDGAGDVCDTQPYPLYDVIEITGLPGMSSAAASDINDDGIVVGRWFDTGTGAYRSFWWDGIMHDLGPGFAVAVNENGQVAGNDGATAWIQDIVTGVRTTLPTLPGGTFTEALDLNDHGHVVGMANLPGSPEHAYFWDGSSMRDLGALNPPYTDIFYSKAHAINGAGLVVGESLVGSVADAWANPFTIDASDPVSVMAAIPDPGGQYISGSAWGVNEDGHVTGWMSTNDDTWGNSFRFDGTTIEILPKVPGKWHAIPTDINASDHVVGYGFGEWVYYPCCGTLASYNIYRAFLNDGDETHDLNELIDAASGWVLTRADAINGAGQIVGSGSKDGASRPFLLDPVETCQVDLGHGGHGDGVLTMCGTGLASGESSTLAFEGGQASTTALLLAGVNAGSSPLLGGQLVPFPVLILVALPLDGQGAVSIPNVPGGLGPATLYAQVVYPYAAVPAGYGISNALEIRFEP